jgi:superfamily II DNA/RNA helicase
MSDLQNRRDEIAQAYFDALPFDPYPVQEDALLNWFTAEQGILVCAPTGTGKTLIAEAAIFEALHLGKKAYYTTPLIALTDQKFQELGDSAEKWGFSRDDVGLVTGNRKVNPDAPIQVVVAEILLNRLLHAEAFDFNDVWAVVMDEFHSFNDRERGIVWEFGLGLLPEQVRTLLISATVGNSMEFNNWLATKQNRKLKLIESHDRKVPLSFSWVNDALLADHAESMVRGDGDARYTPALIFCFNREQCWTVAEQLKGKKVVEPSQQKQLAEELSHYDWSQGAGPKMKQILMRGIGVHHAGVLPKYRRIVEDLFQKKLLSICVCTETLAAGINLPARSVVLPTILKGPPKKLKLIEASSAHQMFGRAGRPQYDDRGYVFALAHEDDVKILRAQEKLNQIPEDTKDPGLMKMRKQLKKKMPKRREGVQYWSEQQFEQLKTATSADLESRGPLTWRLLAYMLQASPEVETVRKLVSRRLLKGKAHEQAQKQLNRMLITLHRAGYLELEPAPPMPGKKEEAVEEEVVPEEVETPPTGGLSLDLGQRTPKKEPTKAELKKKAEIKKALTGQTDEPKEKESYKPTLATPTEKLDQLLLLRGVHPLYGLFLMNHLGAADLTERIQAMESLLELPRSLGPAVRVPKQEELPPGPLATGRLDEMLLKLGLASQEEIYGKSEEDEDQPRGWYDEDDRVWVLSLAQKLQRLFQYDYPAVDDLRVFPCWVAGELMEFGFDFNKYITSKKLQKQEGMVFRHLLRLVLLIDEVAQLCPPDITHDEWKQELGELADKIEACCLSVDPMSTEQWLENVKSKQEDL